MVRKTTKTLKAKPPSAAKILKVTPGADEASSGADFEKTGSADAVKVLGKRELIDRVVKASGIKKKAAKPVIEAVLKELGDAVSRGETLNLQPFGKANVKRSKDLEHAEILEVRLRRSKLAIKAAEEAAAPLDDTVVVPLDPLAEPAE